MRILLLLLFLAIAIQVRSAFPVFFGGTTDYVTNTGNYVQWWGFDARLGVPSAIMSVNRTNSTVGIGVTTANSGASALGFDFLGRTPPSVSSGNGSTAAALGGFRVRAGQGGSATTTGTASGGAGGNINLTSGAGGVADSATTSSTGGSGGSFSLTASPGGSPSVNATTTTGGTGGGYTMTAGPGGTPSSGTTRNGGNGGSFTMLAGAAGVGGGGTPGTPGNPGVVSITGGAGANGSTNSNGGSVFIAGGSGGNGATPGNVVLARTSAGSAGGAVQIGPIGSAGVTNWLTGTATLDFGNTAAAGTEDLPITVTGATTNDVAQLGVPWQSAIAGGTFTPFTSNGVVYVRFANHTGGNVDPASGIFRAFVTKVQ